MRVPAIFLAVMFGVSAPCAAFAQGQQPAPGDAQQSAPDGDADQTQLLDAAQLDQLVAPIALYPDTLLAQVLMASTYPLEIVQAARWMEANKALKGEALETAAAKEDWDDSVKALVATPTVITMMNDQLDWTQSLGDAVLAQQADVMDAVQRLRTKAEDNGKLETTEQQTVTTTQQAGKEVIVIEPASPEVVYVPYYEPAVVYGAWAYPSYPPYYFPPAPGWVYGGALARGMAWGAGFAIGYGIWNNYDPFDWGRNNIRVNVNKNVNINNINVNRNNLQFNDWKHNSYHRRGVSYKNQNVRNQYGKGGGRSNQRNLDYRGHGGKQVLKPGGTGPGGRPDFGGKGPGGKGPGGKGPDFGKGPGGKGPGGKGPGGKGPGGKGPDLGGKGPGGKGPGGKGPDLGNKRPGGGKQATLKDRTPSKPSAPKAKRPSPSKGAKKGGAFNTRDGGKAKSYSKRGQSSLGKRSPRSFSGGGGGGGGRSFKGGGRGGGGGRGRGGGGRRR